MRYIIILFLLCIISDVNGQFGLRLKYQSNQFSDWNDGVQSFLDEDVFASNVELGVDYWFRLKNQRIEFMPEIFYGLPTTVTEASENYQAKFSYAGFAFNTQIYPFDFTGDCDCPTFSKQGPTIQKGFFISFTPSVMYTIKDILDTERHLNYAFGLGAGFDIGLTDLITISPSVAYHLSPGLVSNELDWPAPMGPSVLESDLSRVSFQLRLGFRADYVKSYGRR